MAKISQLPLSDPLNGEETIPVVQGAVTKRSTMSAIAAAAAALLPAFFKGEKGDAGGNVMAIALFMGAAGVGIPNGTDMIRTAGYSIKGVGDAAYVADAAVDAAFVALNPRTAFISNNGRGFRLAEAALRPEVFGAVGDGVTNDTLAFEALSARLEAAGGGVIDLRPNATYVVGLQTLNGTTSGFYSWIPKPIIRCRNGTKPIVVNGNGAKMIAAAGLRYGTFNPVTGDPLVNNPGYTGPLYERASPYEGMIEFLSCTGGYTIRDVTLDGRMHTSVLGGFYSDGGRQISGSGMMLLLNSGGFLIDNVVSDNQPFDGLQLCQIGAPSGSTRGISINALRCRGNGRQGLPIPCSRRGSTRCGPGASASRPSRSPGRSERRSIRAGTWARATTPAPIRRPACSASPVPWADPTAAPCDSSSSTRCANTAASPSACMRTSPGCTTAPISNSSRASVDRGGAAGATNSTGSSRPDAPSPRRAGACHCGRSCRRRCSRDRIERNQP